jgi:MoxR-like ATPase
MIDTALIADVLAGYDPNASEDDVATAERQRAEFLEKFPKDAWPSMTLDRYALGQPDHQDTFCRWMEFVTTELGSMRGGSARKHLIYFQAKTGEWWFDHKLYETVDEAWAGVHAGLLDAVRLAESGQWAQIEQIASLRGGRALVNKTLATYFPDQLLPINSETHLRHFLKALGEPRASDPTLATTTLNRLLLEDLRAVPELDGWSTKQLERLLYTSDLDPFMALLPTGPIANVPSFIAATLTDSGDERVETRRQTEDQARQLLDASAGQMSEEQARELLTLFNSDSKHGKPRRDRFAPGFGGQIANALLTDLANFNHWTGRLWNGSEEERRAGLGELLENRKLLPSAGTSYPTMLAYLKDPEAAAIWQRSTDRGLQRLTDYRPAKGPGNGLAADYDVFCEAASTLMKTYEIPPEMLDALLAIAARVDEPPPPVIDPSASRAWVFQANPSIYNIDLALSEVSETTWRVRQHKDEIREGDRVYIWRSGSDAGIVATGTVLTNPALSSEDEHDPYTLKPEALPTGELSVGLRIDSQVAPVLRRSTLREHPVLKDLEVIRFTQATNFRVTPEQDAVLRSLVTGLRMPTLRPELEERVFLPRGWLEDALELLKEKGQIVFYGPPGTGKTFVALALAEEITRDGGAFRVVQFHPSYSYEDFVGGFRPVEDDGAHGVRYHRTDGPLREIARDAAADPSRPYVLIVDEINRGNIPKIFGELLFLLEYRQKGVRLQYWPEREFTLPANLFVIGTMNTADRSIALVDAALRRRFYFVEFAPTEEPVKWVLSKWLSAHQLGDDPARLLSLLNDEIADNDVAIGPAYFMTDAEAGPDLDRIWQRAIMPLLEEYFYGTKWDRERFSLKRLLARLTGTPETEMPTDDAEASESAT